jgi:hypothetical protein
MIVAVTDLLKTLLHEYGILTVSLSKLEGERPGNPHESLNAYYESMGTPYEGPASVMREKIAALDPDEPKLVVGISADGPMKIRAFEENGSDTEGKPSAVRFLELPEDEFYFFKAFRHGLFEWEKQVPTFLLQMAFVHAYTLFESYLRGILSLRLQAHPQQIGLKKQITYGEIFASASKEELMERIIERELSQLMYEPIESLLAKMRDTCGFRNVSTTHDGEIRRLALTRNCLMHNAAKVSDKLAKAEQSMTEGQRISIRSKTISEAIHTYRQFCLETDQAFESL